MKMRFLTTVILFLFLCAILCGCDAFFSSPFNGIEIDNQTGNATVRLYVYGAVANEGYVEVAVGSTYRDAIFLAGMLPESVLPSYALTIVENSLTRVAVNYYDRGVERQCVNVNGALILNRFDIEGISFEVVNKLADYIEKNGKITNKQTLEAVLGDDYLANFYKLYVAEEDYEKAD